MASQGLILAALLAIVGVFGLEAAPSQNGAEGPLTLDENQRTMGQNQVILRHQ